MSEAKYIIIDNTKPVIFSSAIPHSDEAAGRNVTSAGFVNISVKTNWIKTKGFNGAESVLNVECYGDSVSLGGIKSKATDYKLINAMFK